MGIARLFAADVRTEDAPHIVPIETATGKVGARFIEQLAAKLAGAYERSPLDIGLMNDFSVLKGRWCEPAKVHPLIREFYEHTTRFSVAVRPHWNPLFKPMFWLFRRIFCELVGQFNLPIDQVDARRGIDSYIDVIDLDRDKVPDVRGWVRTYANSDETIYVGIYTVAQLSDGAYVSVGFPLPESNLTATLVPMNLREHDFLLTSKKLGAKYAGDYIAFVDDDHLPKRVSAFRMRGLREEIEVYVRDGELLTDHRFYFLGCNFLTLFYELERKPRAPAEIKDVKALMTKAPSLHESGCLTPIAAPAAAATPAKAAADRASSR